MGSKAIERFLKEYIKPQFRQVLAIVICTAISSLCTVATAKFVKPIIDDVFVNKDVSMLSTIAVCFLAISVLRGGGDYISSICLSKLWQSIVKKIQVRMFSHLLRSDLATFTSEPCGRLVSRLTNDIGILHNIVMLVISEFFKDVVIVFGIIVVIFLQDPMFSIFVIIGFSATVFPTIQIGKKARGFSTMRQILAGHWVSFLVQSFQGIRLIKSYGMENYQSEKAHEITDNVYKLSIKSARTKALIHPIIEILVGVAVAIIVLVGGWLVIHGYRTPGTLLSFLTALIMVYKPIKNLANSNSALQEGVAAAVRIYNVIDNEPTIVDCIGAAQLKVSSAEIRFEDVTFKYEKGDDVIRDFSLVIPPKKTIALVGHSGSGKSTLINLISRFYDVQKGRITIDGHDIKSVSIKSLRENISLVSQDVTLFNDTVYNNIAFGNIDASEEDIIEAARRAAAYDFIMNLEDGFQTVVGENGASLSGGQRQRVSIARAFLKNSPILLLDEATSALDSESEKHIQIAMKKLLKGKTAIIIAHRLSTVLDADKIIVLKHGEIIESGTHQELIALNGHYAMLYNIQQFG